MDGVIGAGRLPSATSLGRVKPESGSKRKDNQISYSVGAAGGCMSLCRDVRAVPLIWNGR
ncbi:MAG TPA: hypothetical protein GXX19_00570 [Syntrophomonadaceae bacterium]|nr:hypothetical protein [Syntrophomonadaceae bacterium]